MDIRRLTHLVALADELHFARAAERVHLSQPAFSRSIQAVEGELGLRLFERDVGEVRPTPAGEFVIERARRLLFQVRCTQRDFELYGRSELGKTAVGMGPMPAVSLMPLVMTELRRRFPRVCVRVEVGNWQQLLKLLMAEEIEFFVAHVLALPDAETLEVRPLPGLRAHLFVRAGHPLAQLDCNWNEAWTFGVAVPKVPPEMKVQLARLLGLPAGQEPEFALECDNFALLRDVALSTDTVLGATYAALLNDLEAGRLVPLRMPEASSLVTNLGIVSLRHRTTSPMAGEAMACIARVATEVSI